MHWTVRRYGGPTVTHGSALIDDCIYAFGGCFNDMCGSYHSPQSRIYTLDTKSVYWTILPPLTDRNGTWLTYPDVPSHRFAHSAVVYKSKIYLLGGSSPDLHMEVFCFDPKTISWSRPKVWGSIPTTRVSHSACVHGEFMYVFGGYVHALSTVVRNLYTLNLETFEWKSIQTFGSLPSPRRFHSAVAFNNRMYVFGGCGAQRNPYHTYETINCCSIFYLDLKTKEWHKPTTTGSNPIGRQCHSMFIHNEIIYIYAGYNIYLDLYFNDLVAFDPEKNCWLSVKPKGIAPSAREHHSTIVKGNRMFLFGGATETEHYGLLKCNDTHVLDFLPSLKTWAMIATMKNNLSPASLPRTVRKEMFALARPLYRYTHQDEYIC